ncbi:MAG TPA: PqqD family protein [Syntrophorhabdales bacterium]|nr:PqqD family protein [Syntrophorhabdales bacterium]
MGKISLNKIYKISEDVVAREVAGEFIIIPITSGIGDMEDEIFTLNGTGRAIWDKLDGNKNLREIAKALVSDFKGSPGEIEKDVAGLAGELLKRRILIEVK